MSNQLQAILVTGRDRVRFLHNFCTADIRGLSVGRAAEAFFTDARARIVAHGYVLMLEDQLQIWLLSDDPQRLHKHLDRYIISEDVKLILPDHCDSFAVHASGLSSLPGLPVVMAGNCSPVTDPNVAVTGLCVSWSGQLLVLYCGTAATIAHLRQSSDLQPKVISDINLQQYRITERYPIIGTDLSIDHLAPEADRNAQAISYNKGCYLGQEPIARIDALGHINRALRLVRLSFSASETGDSVVDPATVAISAAGAELLLDDGAVAATLTSATAAENEVWGLAVLRLATVGQITRARLVDGRVLSVAIP
ncbi:MAG: YgfZ/GcvT domain-containing protein [Planctomycetaceae bacterium]